MVSPETPPNNLPICPSLTVPLNLVPTTREHTVPQKSPALNITPSPSLPIFSCMTPTGEKVKDGALMDRWTNFKTFCNLEFLPVV
ncbi:hypothetical protein CDAR_289501 [Caerostris darwini]|uniref:Uncharacterized protein n=1 Tax=Caerostris darwini TaxID=1538125 RepID=A0AAV4UGX9_9ARAC|nr:hypothetical protein CDAR_289501 [Caerostris darwini]